MAENNINIQTETDKRLENLLTVIQAFAGLDFEKQLPITGEDETYDALACGINMLGEELQESTFSLKEKDLLLKEIHHRVKNNLQIISSLLNLQASKTPSEEFRELMNSLQTRIKAMSLVHEQLYQTKEFAGINFCEYLKNLCQMLDKVYDPDQKTEFEVLLPEDDCFLSIDLSIPVGLMVNELVTNSYKHAFDENTKGKITVQVKKESEEPPILYCRDNGKGIPERVPNATSLGLELVAALSEQIGAVVKTKSSKEGTETTVQLPKETTTP